MQLLVAEEARKPTSKRPASSLGTPILTNVGNRELMRLRVLNRMKERGIGSMWLQLRMMLARIEAEVKKSAAALSAMLL